MQSGRSFHVSNSSRDRCLGPRFQSHSRQVYMYRSSDQNCVHPNTPCTCDICSFLINSPIHHRSALSLYNAQFSQVNFQTVYKMTLLYKVVQRFGVTCLFTGQYVSSHNILQLASSGFWRETISLLFYCQLSLHQIEIRQIQ